MVFTCQLESYFHENLPYTNFIFNDSKQAYIYVTINATQIVVVDYTFKLLLLSCDMHHIHFITYCCIYSRRRGRFFVVLLNIRPLWIAHTKKRAVKIIIFNVEKMKIPQSLFLLLLPPVVVQSELCNRRRRKARKTTNMKNNLKQFRGF